MTETEMPAGADDVPGGTDDRWEVDRREVRGWQMYDWAWSAFQTTVLSAILGPYLLDLAERNGGVHLPGLTIDPGSFFPFAISLSALLQIPVLPLMGAVADHTPHKKRLMMGLAYTASALTAGLFLVTVDTVWLGGLLFVVAGLCFAASSVIYNSYLPEIVPPALRDRVSANGFAFGYCGGGVWLALNVVLILLMEDTGLAVRISLGGTGVWGAAFFLLFPQRLIRPRPALRAKPSGVGWMRFGFRAVSTTLRDLYRDHPVAFLYLIAYLIYYDGITTVQTVATVFAADELDAEADELLLLVLLVQFVAVPGAVAFGRLAERFGARRMLQLNLAVWIGLVVYAFALLRTVDQLWFLGIVLALVQGGAQGLSRSLFSQMIPASREAEYFGFYELAARGTSWLGPGLFGLVNQVVGSARSAILSLIVFFVVGLVMLIRVDVGTAMRQAGQDPTGVTL